MDVSYILQVLAAAQAASAPEPRRLAAQINEQMKSGDLRSSTATALALADRGRPFEARHFGYSILLHLVHSRWTQFQPNERVELARVAFERLREVATTEGELWAIKAKASALVAEVVRQDGPQTWKQLSPELLAMGATGAKQAEIVAHVLKMVAEDIAVYNEDLEGTQMRNLLSALTASLPDVLGFLYKSLESNYGALAAPGGAMAPDAAARTSAVTAALSAAAVYMEWAPLTAVARCGLIPAVCHLLCNPEFRSEACEAVRQVCSRRVSETDDDRAALVAVFDDVSVSLSAAASAVLSETFEPGTSTAEFAERLSDTVSTHAMNHLPQAADRRMQLLSAMMGFTRHPHLLVSGATTNAWSTLLRSAGGPAAGAGPRGQPGPGKTDGTIELPAGLVEALLETCAGKLALGGGLVGGLGAGAAFLQESELWLQEFDSAEVARETWISTRARLLDVCRMIAALAPASAAAATASRLAAGYAATAQAGGGGVSPAAAPKAEQRAFMSLEGAVSLLEPVMAGFADTALAPGGAAAPALEGALAAILQMPQVSPAQPQQAAHRARSLEAFGRLAASRPDMAAAILGALFSLLGALMAPDAVAVATAAAQAQGQPQGATAPNAAGAGAPPVPAGSTRQGKELLLLARQRVCTAVLGVCAAAGAALQPHLQPLANQLASMQLEGTERGSLAEALVAVALSGPTRSAAEVMRWVLGPTATRWAAEPPSVSVASCCPPNWTLFHDVQIVDRCMRRCAAAGAYEEVVEHARWAVPHVLRVLTGIHSLWTAEARAQLPPHLQPALAMAKEEIAVYLAKRVPGMGAGEEAEALATPACPEAEDLRGWLRGVRDSGYGLVAVALAPGHMAKGEPPGGAGPASPRSVVGAAAAGGAGAAGGGGGQPSGSPGAKGGVPAAPPAPEGLYATDGVAEALASALLSQLPSMEGRHLRSMIRGLVHPVLVRCPPARRRQWFGAVLPALLPHAQARLAAGWTALLNSPAFQGKAEGVASAAEVVEERLLRDLTRSHMALLSALATLDATPPSGHASTGGVGAVTGTRWFDLGDAGGLAAGLATAIASLTWPDSDASLKGVTVCRTAVTVSAEPTAPAGMRELAATELLRGSVSALTLGSNSAHQAEIMALIRDALLKLSPLVEGVKATFAQVTQSQPEGVEELLKQLAACASDKQQRTKLRAFLLAAGGSHLDALAPHSTRATGAAVVVTRMGPPSQRIQRGAAAGDGTEPLATAAFGLA